MIDEKLLYQAAVRSYKDNNTDLNDDFKIRYNSPTLDCYVNEDTKQIIIAVRGTRVSSMTDIKADASLPFNNLHNTKRFIIDDKLMKTITAEFPSSTYEYYMVGHSLGSAIMNELMRHYPFIKKGVAYNGAYQAKDLINQNPDIKRMYIDKDFLYKKGGFLFNPKQVIAFKSKGFFDWFFNRISGTKQGLAAHSLSNFKEYYGAGTEKEKLVQSIILHTKKQKKI